MWEYANMLQPVLANVTDYYAAACPTSPVRRARISAREHCDCRLLLKRRNIDNRRYEMIPIEVRAKMAFNSLSYFLFLALVYLLFYFAADRLRWLLLLVASYGFYASLKAPQLLLVLGLLTVLTYVCGIRIGRSVDHWRRGFFFWSGVAGSLLILFVMKYLPPLLNGGNNFPYPGLLISVGVSYFVFQGISYLADVYLELVAPEPHLGYHALGLAFFPKLLQGPIERSGDLLPQLKKPYQFDYLAMRSALLLFCWGLFKKVVLADRLALYSDTVFSDVHAYRGPILIVATYTYALQIYFDFAGYTDMARGAARLFGVELTENFNSPYLATSVAEFWRRWHITFSRWILDYIFTPLQMSWRYWGKWSTPLALLVTFLASGIWHGASWGFVAWGALHGVFLASHTFYRPYQTKLHKKLGIQKSRWYKAWQCVVTFNLVCLAWVFFRAQNIGDALYLLNNLTDDPLNLMYAGKFFGTITERNAMQ